MFFVTSIAFNTPTGTGYLKSKLILFALVGFIHDDPYRQSELRLCYSSGVSLICMVLLYIGFACLFGLDILSRLLFVKCFDHWKSARIWPILNLAKLQDITGQMTSP